MTRLSIPVVVLIVLTACGRVRPQHAATTAAAPIRVSAEAVQLHTLVETFEAGGSVRAYLTAAIASRIMAPVVDVKVRAGDRVRAGQALVLLDARELRESRARAEAAALSAAQATASARADESAADAAWHLADASHTRIASLVAKRSATAAEFDAAIATLRQADARKRAAAAQRLQADSAVEAAHAAARAARVAETYAVLTAPFDGLVAERSVDPGNLATPGAPLLTVEDTRRFRVEASVDAAHARSLREGDKALVSIDHRADQPLAATISEIHESVDPVAHSFVVKLDLPAAAQLRSGLFARVTFLGTPRQALAVPTAAVVRRGQLSFVYVDDGGYARLRMVHAGATESGGRIAILAGLAAGDRVIVAPPSALTDGAPIVSADAADLRGQP